MSCNVVFCYVNFSCKCLDKSFKLILDKYYDREVIRCFLDKYISVRYMGENRESKDSLSVSLNKELLQVLENVSVSDDMGKFILDTFKILYYFDDVIACSDRGKYVSILCDMREKRLGLVDSKFSSSFDDVWNEALRRKEKFLDKFVCEHFPVLFKKIFNSNIYDVSIKYDIDVPKLYSKWAVDKVFNTGIVGEDKLFLEYYMVCSNIMKKIIKGKFDSCYLVDFEVGLFLKKEKVSRLLNIVDIDIVKDMVSFKISYSDFLEYKDNIYELMRRGFRFSLVVLDREDINYSLLGVFEYILVNKNSGLVSSFDSYNNVILIR